jgi:hypothetical protein
MSSRIALNNVKKQRLSRSLKNFKRYQNFQRESIKDNPVPVNKLWKNFTLSYA